MTNNQLIKAYDQFLYVYCGCYTDSNGNRPCDNGVLCDRCMREDAQKMWKKIKEDLK